MAKKEYDVWLERFNRECGIKSSIILFGNTSDIIRNQLNSGLYMPVMQTIIQNLRQNKFKVTKWDRVDGIDKALSDPVMQIAIKETTENAYDMGLSVQDMENTEVNYKAPEEFFPFMLQHIRSGSDRRAYILDYSDYLFGSANSLSEKEREYLATLGKALENSRSYDPLDTSENVSIVIVFTQNNATIPPAFYLNNPMVSLINVPLPGRNEREQFVDTNISSFRVTPDISGDRSRKDDFIDALDGFSLKEIMQLMQLSRQITDDRMSCEKLINLYKYGEKVSPWEELSKDKLEQVEERLKERVKGQDAAIQKVKDVLIRAYTGFSGLQHSAKQKKPKGTLFFVGPTGVGKTELAKSLAEFVFGDENACIRFDMSEYNHEHSDQRLVGAPPGYVGYEAGGQLTNAIKERPFCVLLFDEIEKAHGKILDKFLQILEDGRLTDGKGETVYFSESIIIFTSNIGASKVQPGADPQEISKQFISEVKSHFVDKLGRPELLNRIGDNIVAFNFISDASVFTQIAKIKFRTIEEFVKERYHADLQFENEDAAFLEIAKKADISNGGRGLLNVMEASIINPLSEYIFRKSEALYGRKIIISSIGNALFDFDLG